MIQSGKAISTVQTFMDAYLVCRDIGQALDCLSEHVQWVGSGRSELFFGREQAEQALKLKLRQEPGAYRVGYDSAEETIITDCCVMILLTGTVSRDYPESGSVWFRVTSTCVEEEDGGIRIASIHVSIPGSRQGESGAFPASDMDRSEMEHRLGAKTLDILARSIHGGMMGGYLEPEFPLYYVNDPMLSYLGYTYDGFVAAIRGKVINCMHPDDRERVDALVTEAFSHDLDYEIQYRMLKADGNYIWVNDIGKKGLSEDGRQVCVSVIRDISAEIEAQERLKEQAAKQERLAVRYDHLFQSVLCGIVQYRQTSQGIVFKNANREAIRIFGYTQEEFWDMQNWHMPDLVVEEDREYCMEVMGRLQSPGDKAGYEYRLRQKDGAPCWIIGSAEVLTDAEGNRFIQSVYLDINDRKETELDNRHLSERLEASNEILHLALEHTTTSEFYYYPQTAECTVPARTSESYHCREHYDHMPQSFAQERVDAAFRPGFYEMYECIHRGGRTASCEFRGLGGNFWCRETLSVILDDENGSPRLVIGIVENITRQKEAEEALLEAKSYDGLTGLFKRECGIQAVQDYLRRKAPEESDALMLFDMDDFEDINQKEGTIFADAILQEVADILRSETGAEDIPVRVGGDEFILFIKNCDYTQAGRIGGRIACQVKNILVNSEKDIHVSVSAGICCTEVVEEYNALYRCAESTLKYVKEHGKGQAACYLDTSNELGVFLTQLYTGEHTVHAIGLKPHYTDGDLVSFALDLLGRSKNLDDAVFLLLSRIGKNYHFDRVSIIEASRAFLTYRFSYQWARNRADLQLGQDFYVSDEDFDICNNMYDEDGLADHNVRAGISHIASCLHAGIWNYGEYVGSMSFEVNQEQYQWSQEQRKLLKELVRIIPSFVMKSKADAVSRAKTDFLSRMSHEIRTPMNAISGMTTIAKNVLDDRARILECLEKIESANGYLLSLINDILDMSRIESGKMELNYGSMDIMKLQDGLESLFQVQADAKNLELRFKNGFTENRLLRADSLRLNQVLVNIIGNAIKFTEQGRVTVCIETLETVPRAVLRFSVADTGIGIEQAAMARIFNAFEQADAGTAASYGGTGLGLSISSRLVQMMGGRLEVRSQPGTGSEFFFRLTFEYAREEAEHTAIQEPEVIMDFNGRHILLAEDNELNREISQTILEMNGFTITCAVDGREALEQFCANEPETFDAILMDIRMPVMDGLEATRRIRTSGKTDARTIPIIALSANAFDEDTRKSMDSGMNGHLAKPIQMKQLLGLLSRCIGG